MTRSTPYGLVQRAADCAGLTQRQLARVLGCSVRSVAGWAVGEHALPRAEELLLEQLCGPREGWPANLAAAVRGALWLEP